MWKKGRNPPFYGICDEFMGYFRGILMDYIEPTIDSGTFS